MDTFSVDDFFSCSDPFFKSYYRSFSFLEKTVHFAILILLSDFFQNHHLRTWENISIHDLFINFIFFKPKNRLSKWLQNQLSLTTDYLGFQNRVKRLKIDIWP
jgi:hypothetical protein